MNKTTEEIAFLLAVKDQEIRRRDAVIEKLKGIAGRALLLTMDGDCEECGYDSDDESDTHAVNCEALALNLELNAIADSQETSK